MAAVKLYLRGDKIKPTINIETAISTRTALIDTGANMPIRFSDTDTFLLEFPDAEETKYVTYIGGLGGFAKQSCPVYKIPALELADKDNESNRFIIHELFIAIYDADKNYGYDLILGSTIFNKVDYAFINRDKIRHMVIYFDRDVYSTVRVIKDDSGDVVKVSDKIVISDVHTFFRMKTKCKFCFVVGSGERSCD